MKMLRWGIYLVIFCLPLYLVRFRILNIPTNVLEAIIGILFLIWLIYLIKGGIKGILRDNQGGAKGLVWPILLIVIGVSVATVFSWNLRMSAGIWKSWFIVPLLFFIVLISIIKNSEQVKKVFWSFILSGFVVSVISLVYLFQGNLNSQGRLQGFYNSPNYLAMYLAPILLVSFGYCFFTFFASVAQGFACGLRTRSETISKTFILLNIILLLLVLFFTKSFGAWLGIIVGICFGLVIYFYRKRKKKLSWVILGLTFLIILTLSYIVLIQRESSLNARLLIWQKAWQVFKMYPVIGIGPGTFEDYFSPYPKWGVPQPHNLYLAFLLQTGIIGFIGFIWLLVWFFSAPGGPALGRKKGFELLKTQNLLVIINMSVMVYILVHGLIDTLYWKNDLAVVFWIIIGLMIVLSRQGSGSRLRSGEK